MMKGYEWKKGLPCPPVAASAFGAELEAIEERDGKIDPSAVVASARDPKSPIHAAFNWDDKTAAEGFRRDQARRWIGALTVVRVTLEKSAPAPERQFYSVRNTPSEPLGYQSRDRIMTSTDLRRQLIEKARDDLCIFASRYGSILEGTVAHERLKEAIAAIKDEADALAFEANRRGSRRPGEKTDLHAEPKSA